LKASLSKWTAWLLKTLLSYGVWGLAGIAFVDSALVPLPQAVDVLVISLSAAKPEWMVLYVLSATLGSVAGCLFLYGLARAGGRAFLEKHVGAERSQRIRQWFERHEFLTVMVPSILPPPTPLKAFVIVAGVVEVPVAKFAFALFLGRAFRYGIEGWLGVRYGEQVWETMKQHGVTAALVALGLILLWWLIVRFRQSA
jgi:membrane protein YqaA with SNARE-associated domain